MGTPVVTVAVEDMHVVVAEFAQQGACRLSQRTVPFDAVAIRDATAAA